MLNLPDTFIRNLQKICDIYDLFDPAIDLIVKKTLQTTPFAGRRTWEFAMIYLALQKAGHIHANARGLAMGAGKERLIFSIAREVQNVVATDLYLPDRGWAGVRTNDPQKLLMDAAPWPVPEGRINAMAMDMRELKFSDNSFDFAWSTGAFEHIGEDKDFATHLAEVYRVLKPGGVYAFTTVVTFGEQSECIPHNYYFHPAHLFEIVDNSPLTAAEEFDCRLNDHLLNRPLLESCQDFGFEAANLMISPLISFRRGILTAANLVVLTKYPAAKREKTSIIGFEETRTKLVTQASSLTKRLWRAPQIINVFKPTRDSMIQTTQWHYFGKRNVKLIVRVSTPLETDIYTGEPSGLAQTSKRKEQNIPGSSVKSTVRSGYNIKIFRRQRNFPHKAQLDRVVRGTANNATEIRLKSSEGALYKFHFACDDDSDFILLHGVEA